MPNSKRHIKISKLFQSIDNTWTEYEKFNDELDSFVNIGSSVASISKEFLLNLETELSKVSGLMLIKDKLKRDIKVLESIQDHPLLTSKYKIIFNQATVLLVSGFESFMKGFFVSLLNEDPEMMKWEEKKRANIELETLKYYPSVGDAIASSLSGDINFQDLQSTLRFLKNVVQIQDIDFMISDVKEVIILNQALRHIIIHNSSIVDHNFLRQIRTTSYYREFEPLNGIKVYITSDRFIEARKAFEKFINSIFEGIGQRMGEEVEK